MSVLIKGMDMPERCDKCPIQKFGTNEVGYCYYCGITGKEIDDGNEDWCPLVEVKDKPRDSNGRFYSGMEEEWVDIDNLENEEWKPVKGYEERYMVSNMGRVRSRTKILSCGIKGDSYAYVILNNGDVKHRKTKTIHRLVAEHFVRNPHPDRYKIINHKDENKKNNRADNLEWCNHKHNLSYGKNAPIKNLKHYAPTVIETEE